MRSRVTGGLPVSLPARPPKRPIDNIGFQWERLRAEAGLPGLSCTTFAICVSSPKKPLFLLILFVFSPVPSSNSHRTDSNR